MKPELDVQAKSKDSNRMSLREEIQNMIAIQFTNGFEINVIDVCGRAIYPTISRINHSCVPSIAHANVKKNGEFSSCSSGDDSDTCKIEC